MNDNFKTLYRISFMLCFMLFFISCEKDLYEESLIEQKRGIISRRISFNELKTNPNVIKELNNAKDKLKPKLIGNERIINVGDFFIETDDVLLLEYGALKSYTFPIYFTEEGAKLKNLVIAEKLDGTYTTKILEYELTTQEKIDLANDELQTISNPIVTTILNNSEGCTQVSYSVIVACSTGQHNATNIDFWYLCVAPVRPKIKVITEVTCNGGSNGGDGPSNGVSYDYPDSQTNPEEYENGITEPVNPNLNNVNITFDDPCTRIKAKTSSTDYMLKFNNINKPENFNLSQETGFFEKKINGNTTYVNGVASGNAAIDYQNNTVGYTHVHNNKPFVDENGVTVDLAVKIQSKSDLFGLIKSYSYSLLTEGNPHDNYGVMISDEGIFAITVLDPNISSVNLNAKLNKFATNYNKLFLKIIEEHNPVALKKQKMQEMFLLLLKDANLQNNIALFEGTTQTIAGITKINWMRKTLNISNNLAETPCQ